MIIFFFFNFIMTSVYILKKSAINLESKNYKTNFKVWIQISDAYYKFYNYFGSLSKSTSWSNSIFIAYSTFISD